MKKIIMAMPFILIIAAIGATGFLFYNIFFLSEEAGVITVANIVSILVILLCIFLLKVTEKKYYDIKSSLEYDEFGRNKKVTKYNYSKEERKKLDLQKIAEMESLLSEGTLKSITHSGSKNPEIDMKNLIGLEETKTLVEEMVARMQFDRSRKVKDNKNSESGRHMVFMGNPGTGKTTMARIITGFLYKNGNIQKNKIIEIDGNFLKAGTGNTSTKVKLVTRCAYGGVLFIDEAYALMDAKDGSSEEAIATLIAEMENNRDKFILILAGYTDEMKELISQNPGFASRIKEYINFPDYTDRDMWKIFNIMAKSQGLSVRKNAAANFKIRIQKERESKFFGNARTARNILDETIDRHALNLYKGIINKEDKLIINNEDIPVDIKKNSNVDFI